MSDDIVERLRKADPEGLPCGTEQMCDEAADEIERLRKAEEHILKVLELANKNCHERNRQIDRLRKALIGVIRIAVSRSPRRT
jgi:hypothetical protein